MTTPLSGDAFRFVVPQIVVPGERFRLEAAIVNSTADTLSGVKVEILAPPGATLVRGTAKLGSRVLRMKDERTAVTLPALKPGTEMILSVEAIIEPPAEDSSGFTFRAESTAHGAAREIEQLARVQSRAAFEDETTVLLLDTSVAAPGEQRTAVASLCNVGTMTARDATIRFNASGATIEQGDVIRVQDLLPNDVVDVPFSLVVDPSDRLERGTVFVGGEVLVGGEVAHTFESVTLTIVPPARFTSAGSSLAVDGDTTRAAGPLPVTIRLRNEGERPAREVEARLVFEGGIDAPQGAVARFASIEPGASVETPMLLAATASGSIRLIVGEQLLGQCSIEIGSTPSLVPFRFERDADEVTVGNTVGFRFDALSNGYAAVDEAHFSLLHGAGLMLVTDSLTVNGFPVGGDAVALRAIEPGAVVSLGWKARAVSPTLHGTTTSVSVRFAFGDDTQSDTIAPFPVRPAALFPDRVEDLPFELGRAGEPPKTIVTSTTAAATVSPETTAATTVADAPPPVGSGVARDIPPVEAATEIVAAEETARDAYVPFADDDVVAGTDQPSNAAPAGDTVTATEVGTTTTVDMNVVVSATRITETVVPLCGSDIPFPFIAHVAAVAMLAGGNDDPAYEVAVDALRMLVQQAAQTRRATRNRQTAKVDMVARFRQTAGAVVSLANLGQFGSVAEGEPSTAAVIAAIALLARPDTTWTSEARAYLSLLLNAAEAMDGLDDGAFAKRLGAQDSTHLDDALLGVLTRVKSVIPAAA